MKPVKFRCLHSAKTEHARGTSVKSFRYGALVARRVKQAGKTWNEFYLILW